ncbi:MAG TPA: pseudouridine synthase, partial [Herpetosiphonaceae bacterium]
MERLHKFLARAGVDSRRACEELMLAGRVTVNGRTQRELGTQIDPETDDIRVDGVQVVAPTELHYVMLHKPTGVITSMEDPQGRPTVADLVKTPNRLFPVGRLDFDSEGLLLMTDDGDLAFRLTHPSFEVEKEYRAQLDVPPTVEQLRSWREGVELEDGRTAPAWVELLEPDGQGVWVRVVIHEGRNRQVRRVAEHLGLQVIRLIRLREGPLDLGELPAGEWRPLGDDEISKLRLHAKRARVWMPPRPLPESPQDPNPQERRRVTMLDRSGQPRQPRRDPRQPEQPPERPGSRPLRRRPVTGEEPFEPQPPRFD